MEYEFKFPDVGEGITEGEIVDILVKKRSKVKENQPLAKIETDKAIAELPSPKSGRILKINFKKGDTVKVGQTLLTIETTGKKGKGASVVGEFEEATGGENVFERAKKKVKLAEFKQAMPKTEIKRKYDIYGFIEREPFKGARRTIAKHMREAVSNAAFVTQTDEADMTALIELRDSEKIIAEKKRLHLTFLPYIIKACVSALKENPRINSTLDEQNWEIIIKKYYNIGIAVSTGEGLLVPVIKKAEDKGILELAKDISYLAEKARNRTIDIAELKGGTFSITNIGSVGGIFATPITNYPEAAILALGKIKKKPIAIGDRVGIRDIMPLSLTYDHRILDGAEAAAFLNSVVKNLENPKLL